MYDRTFWEQLWAKTLREHPDKVAQRPPNAQLIAEVTLRDVVSRRIT